MLLAGIGVRIARYLSSRAILLASPTDVSRQHVTTGADSQKNFLVVDSKTETSVIEQAFDNFTAERKDIGIILINQHVRTLSLPMFAPTNACFSGSLG